MIWTVEVRDSDGNDCTVYDVRVEADNAEAARNAAFDWVLSESPKGTEADGDWGAYYPCDCQPEDGEDADTFEPQCDGHGGFMVGEPEEGDTASVYHVVVRL